MNNNFYPSHNNKNPYHIGIIPDGARRWAKKNNISYLQSYRISMSKLLKFCKYLFDKKTYEISIYFSSNMLKRTVNIVIGIIATQSYDSYKYTKKKVKKTSM